MSATAAAAPAPRRPMLPMDLVRFGEIQAAGFRLEGEPAKAAVSEAILVDVKDLKENGSTAFGRRFETLRADLHRNARGLPSTAFWAAYQASTA